MKERILFTLIFTVCILACSPKYTADFGPSRNFYEPEKLKTQNSFVTTNENNSNHEFIDVSSEEDLIEASTIARPVVTKVMETRTDKIVEKYAKEGLPSTKEVLKLPAKKRVKLLKEVKKDIKALKKAKKNKSIDNRKVYAGIIIALAGVVVAILASGAIGGLAIIVGVGLIAWGLIEQGSI
ncbi:MAG: hypothetical protein AAGF85_15875 [Bacteroidota bacterium]